MATDPRLQAHVEILKGALAGYVEHLSRAWRGGSDTASNIGLVLGCVGVPVSVDASRRRELLQQLDAAFAIDDGPLALLASQCGFTPGEELLVAAAWWAGIDPQLRSVLGVLHDDGARRSPSTGLLRVVFEPYGIDVPLHPRHLVGEGVLSPESPSEHPSLTPTLLEVLGRDTAHAPWTGAARWPDRLPARLHGTVRPLVALLRSGRGAVTLRGTPGAGRRILAEAAADELGRVIAGRDRADAELRLLARIGTGLPVLDAADAAGIAWTGTDGPMIVIADPEDDLRTAQVIDVPGPCRQERQQLWALALDTLGLTGEAVAVRLADQFEFTERDIDAAVTRARLLADLEGRSASTKDVWLAAQRQPDVDLQRVAVRIAPVYTLDDLVLPEDTSAQLHELVAHVRHRTTVLDGWGFRRRLPRGQGVAALFSGLPGTGKTTAAEAIANELSAELFRVDLSRVVSKYIGETERNLAVAFREAERSGALLLFDEADALFGKRTDVRDAHDRYANLEVSYLLQRIETFTGLVILSTNKQGNIDDAFLRRLRFVVRFDTPDADRRAELWRRSFPSAANVAKLDWAQLATHDLSGGHIQNAAVAAAFLAVAEGVAVGNDHVEHALSREYEKLDRAAPARAAGMAGQR